MVTVGLRKLDVGIRKDLGRLDLTMVHLRDLERVMKDYAERTAGSDPDRFEVVTDSYEADSVEDLPDSQKKALRELTITAGNPRFRVSIRPLGTTMLAHGPLPADTPAYRLSHEVEAILSPQRRRLLFGRIEPGAAVRLVGFWLLLAAEWGLLQTFDLSPNKPAFYVHFALLAVMLVIFLYTVARAKPPPAIVFAPEDESWVRRWKVEIGFLLTLTGMALAVVIRLYL